MLGESKIKRLNELVNPNRRTPLILINQKNSEKIRGIEELLQSIPHLVIDFNEIKDGDLEKYLHKISSMERQIIFFRNIDEIPLGGERESWELIVKIALKQENYPLEVQDCDGYFKKYELPFQNTKIISTCREYPEYLKHSGMLGEIMFLS